MSFTTTAAVLVMIMLGTSTTPLAQEATTPLEQEATTFLAPEVRTGIGYTLGYSDNINLTPQKESSFINTLFVDLSSSRTSSFVDAAIAGRIGYEQYSNKTQDSQPIVNLQANAKFKLSPWIDWVVENNAAQISQDAASPDVPNNQEIQNVFQTGPDLLFKFNPVTYLGYSLRYGNYYFTETTEDNNQRVLNGLRLMYLFTDKLVVSLNSIYQDAYYQENKNSFFNSDFNRLDVSLGLARIDDLTSFRLAIGKTYADQQGLETPDSLLFCTSLTRRLTSDSYFRLAYSRALTELDLTSSGVTCDTPTLSLVDPFQSLIGATFASATNVGNNSASNKLFVEDKFEAFYSKILNPSIVTVGISTINGVGNSLEFEAADQSDEQNVYLTFSYPFANSTIGTNVTYSKQTDFDELFINLGYVYSLNSKTSLGLGYSFDKTIDGGGGAGNNARDTTGSATENRVFVTLTYGL